MESISKTFPWVLAQNTVMGLPWVHSYSKSACLQFPQGVVISPWGALELSPQIAILRIFSFG
jgi:hypothetical protein